MNVFDKVLLAISTNKNGEKLWELGSRDPNGWRVELNQDEFTDLFLAMAQWFPALNNARRANLHEEIRRLLTEHKKNYGMFLRTIDNVAKKIQEETAQNEPG